MDFSSLTGAIDLATVSTAILAIGALKVLPIVGQWGVSMVLRMLGRG